MNKTGRVIQSTGKWYKVEVSGTVVDCRLPGIFRLNPQHQLTNPVAVGDYVDIEIQEDHSGLIKSIHDRKNYILREATHGKKGFQILVSNVDLAWVVQSVRKPKLKTGFIDRFLTTCEAYKVNPGVIVNKADLAGNSDKGYLEDLAGLYTGLGYPVHLTSIYEPERLQLLAGELENKTSVFIGPSGVGKSALLNAMNPDLDLPVGEISGYSGKGKHTTTFARLVPVRGGAYIVDTPGIRELGMVNITPAELSLYYPEMEDPRRQCRFNNCTHSHEPGCGVIEAFERGQIHPERYNSYLNILESLQ